MITLVLIRHAKSDWGDPSVPDHDRPLNPRGRRDAPKAAARFARSGVAVDRILSSTALRARATAQEFAEALGLEIEPDAELYASSASTLLGAAAATGADAVMLIAHDPGITDLAERLSDGGIAHMPTCAVARFSWNATDWGDVGRGIATEWTLITPR